VPTVCFNPVRAFRPLIWLVLGTGGTRKRFPLPIRFSYWILLQRNKLNTIYSAYRYNFHFEQRITPIEIIYLYISRHPQHGTFWHDSTVQRVKTYIITCASTMHSIYLLSSNATTSLIIWYEYIIEISAKNCGATIMPRCPCHAVC
jgi:hypothetical protein